jgi:SAM-dependent methyltransferase
MQFKHSWPFDQRHPLRQRLRRMTRPAWLGSIRRTTPLSPIWGHDRGTPVDRYYIEQFLDRNRQDIRGRVLEIKDSTYTDRFGAGVEQSDVLDIDPSNPRATIVADLSKVDQIPADHYDCVVLTQTLQLIYDFNAAIKQAWRILRPGGVLLATLPGISRVERASAESDYWRFTRASGIALFGANFGPTLVDVHSYGSVLTAIAFLTGMAHEELSRQELETHDSHFPVIIAVRAVKRGQG